MRGWTAIGHGCKPGIGRVSFSSEHLHYAIMVSSEFPQQGEITIEAAHLVALTAVALNCGCLAALGQAPAAGSYFRRSPIRVIRAFRGDGWQGGRTWRRASSSANDVGNIRGARARHHRRNRRGCRRPIFVRGRTRVRNRRPRDGYTILAEKHQGQAISPCLKSIACRCGSRGLHPGPRSSLPLNPLGRHAPRLRAREIGVQELDRVSRNMQKKQAVWRQPLKLRAAMTGIVQTAAHSPFGEFQRGNLRPASSCRAVAFCYRGATRR